MTPTRTQPPSRKRWLHFCESGSDIQEAPALASATEAVFTRILPQQGSDCIWSAGRGHSGLSDERFFPLSWLPGATDEQMGYHCQKRIWKEQQPQKSWFGQSVCSCRPQSLDCGEWGSWRRVTVRLKEKHPGILCCYGLLKLTGFGGHWRYTPFHQIQRDLDNNMYKLSLKCPQEVTTFTMKKKNHLKSEV